MLGLILTTQIVNYPLFLKVNQNSFTSYHQFYVKRISLIVVPVMLLELIISFYLFYSYPTALTILSFIILIMIFLSTFFIQVPIHGSIEIFADNNLFLKLIRTNWIRTVLWFIKGFILIKLFLKELI
tara:strand:- start:766 stop:1146 length:381 start_codon:yes stop_codon:yes gene_type:complete